MAELDIISVQEADNWLSLQLADDDIYGMQEVERLIKSAVAWVERYTGYRLWQRAETIPNSKCTQMIAAYPVSVTGVKNQNGDTITDFKTYVMPTKLRINTPYNSVITLQVGYEDPADIPGPLVEACYKLITYLYENRDTYTAQLPSDVQMLINQYRRAII